MGDAAPCIDSDARLRLIIISFPMIFPPRRRVRAVWRACILALACVVATSLASAVVRHVHNASEFNSLPTTLNAGDVVILHDGVYDGLQRTITSSIADDQAAQNNPVRIYAARPGGVVVTGESRIVLRGRGIVLAGIDFGPGSGGAGLGRIISLDPNSRFMRLNNLRFTDCSSEGTDDYWIRVQGFNHVIEYCSFVGKRSKNVIIALTRATSGEAGPATPRNHVIRHCYFGPRECSVTDNGYESIRIGDSGSQIYDMRVVVERNVFFRSIWRDDGQKPNDPEIISNKSRGNIIRHNTFLESTGQITLRHGDACVVEGNFIFGAGYYSDDGSRILLRATPNPYQGGIRIIGQDHVVRNNYLINLRSTGGRAALCLVGGATVWNDGDGTSGSGDTGYEPADNAQIYHNTFIDCAEMNLGFLNDSAHRTPTGVKIYNNAWHSTVGGNGVVRNAAFTPAGSGGNYFYATGNLGWTGLGGVATKTVSAKITEAYGELLIPTADSPLIDAADSTLTADVDMRGLARPAAQRDIGAFERESVGEGERPLFRHEVGPEFDGGPSGHYPAAIAPSITEQPAGVTATVGDDVLLSVSATGEPAPSYQWLRNGTPVVGNPTATTATLVLSNIQLADAGTYTVRVSNILETIESTGAVVTVNEPPEPFAGFLLEHGLVGSAAAALADPDGDGMVNLVEFVLGTNPTASDSALGTMLSLIRKEAMDYWVFTFKAVQNLGVVSWDVEYSADLIEWKIAQHGTDGVTITSTPESADRIAVKVEFPATTPQAFARLRVTRP